jgi:16S rRNA (uracil1498-N3)-methyltransferase
MSEAWFFHPGELQLRVCALSRAETRHARASRRLRAGDAAAVFNGRGLVGRGRITAVNGEVAEVLVERLAEQARPVPHLALAVAVPKGPRQDLLIEKCTELGVAAVWPLTCSRSVVRPGATHAVKWRRTAVEACKQSHRAWLPEIHEPCCFTDILAQAGVFTHLWIAEPGGVPLPQDISREARILALVGPEGDFTAGEMAQAAAAGFQRVSLGQALLRVETAALAIAARLAIDVPA